MIAFILEYFKINQFNFRIEKNNEMHMLSIIDQLKYG